MRGRGRAFVLNGLLSVAALAVAFLCIEAGLRVTDGVPLTSTDNFIAKRIDLIRASAGPIVYDPVLGWRITEYYAPTIERTALAIGEHGVRMNANESIAPARGAIVVVGSSMTFGLGVRNADTWPARLERLLGEPVVNAAADDWGMDQIVLRSEQMAAALQPKMIVVAVSDADVRRNAYSVYRGAHKPHFVIERGALVLRPGNMRPAEQCIVGTKQSDQQIAQLLVGRLAALRKAGTEVHLLLTYEYATLRSGYGPPYMSLLAGTARTHGISVTDGFEAIAASVGSVLTDRRGWIEPVLPVSPCEPKEQPRMSSHGYELLAGLVARQIGTPR